MMSLRSREVLTAALLVAISVPGRAAEPRSVFGHRPVVAPTQTTTTQPKLIDFVGEAHRTVVSSVLSSPTLATKATEDEFAAHPKVYDFLVAHPDRTAVAWDRLKVPCLEIIDRGKGRFSWSDDSGNELTWQEVGKFENGVVWYATGKVKAGPLIPTVPVKAVAVLQSPRTAPDAASGVCTFKPVLNVYIQCDSRLAAAALRIAGPTAPRLAQEGAEQLLFFFSGVARYLHRKPDQIEPLLSAKTK